MSALPDSLGEQQRAFARAVCDVADQNFGGAVVSNGLGGQRRLNIYRNGIRVGFRDALAGVYEVVQGLVGEEFFARLAEHYVRAHPSSTGNIHDFGGAFAHFLATVPELESLPYLPDVARLEWAYHQVFHASTGASLDLARLAQLPASAHEALRLSLSPACRLLSSDFPVLRIWQANRTDAVRAGAQPEIVSLDEGGMSLALARNGMEIALHPLKAGTYALLEVIAAGRPFGVACVAALDAEAGCDVGAVLQYAVTHQMVTDFLEPILNTRSE